MDGRTRALIGGGAAAVLAAGIGTGYALRGGSTPAPGPTSPAAATATSSAPAAFTLNGQLTLQRGAFQWDQSAHGGAPCAGYQGYSDIVAGASVVITDQGGTVIATGQLATGTAAVDTTTGRATECVLRFAVPDVPARTFYGVTVSHRGAVTFSATDARAAQVRLTLG